MCSTQGMACATQALYNNSHFQIRVTTLMPWHAKTIVCRLSIVNDVPVVPGRNHPAHSGYLGKLNRLGEISALPTEDVLLKLQCHVAPKTFKHRFRCACID